MSRQTKKQLKDFVRKQCKMRKIPGIKKRLAESLQQAYPYHPKQNTKEHILHVIIQ